MVFFALFILPLLIAIGGFVFLKGITWKELAVQVAVQAVVAGVSLGIVSCQNESDAEVWNGTVVSKERTYVSCSHSYQCNCHESCSGSGNSKNCSTSCDTCYEHSNDWDWDVFTSNRETITIDRIDRQGAFTPPRWSAVVFNEPTSIKHSYRNYIKAAPGTLFRHQGLKNKFRNVIPNYPGHVYDYYRLSRLVTVGVTVPDAQEWNNDLSVANAMLGQAKQANIITVLVHNLSEEYFYALEEAWLGGKKNDIVLVVSVDDNMKPQWADVMAWTTQPIFKIKLRDAVMSLPTLTRTDVLSALRTNVATYYKRKPMADFAYLRSSMTPTAVQWVVSMLIGVLLAVSLTIVFQLYDPFGKSYFHVRRNNWPKSRSKRYFR